MNALYWHKPHIYDWATHPLHTSVNNNNNNNNNNNKKEHFIINCCLKVEKASS
jgi:hypothetical protein